jgi:hypothetical protein
MGMRGPLQGGGYSVFRKRSFLNAICIQVFLGSCKMKMPQQQQEGSLTHFMKYSLSQGDPVTRYNLQQSFSSSELLGLTGKSPQWFNPSKQATP